MVVFDTNMLIALVAEDTSPEDRARLDGLVKELAEAKTYIGIPTPALAEFWVDAEQATSELFKALHRKNTIRFLPFDEKAAFEAALIARSVRESRQAMRGSSTRTAQQVKVDRQIVAIAKVAGAKALYSDDDGLRKEAQSLGIEAFALSEIKLPASARQQPLFPPSGSAKAVAASSPPADD